MENINQVKGRAEELLENLQSRGRTMMDTVMDTMMGTESVKTVRAKIEAHMDAKGLTQTEARKRFDAAVAQLKAKTGQTKERLIAYRAQLESCAGASFTRIKETATSAQASAKQELDGMNDKVKGLSKKFGKFTKKFEGIKSVQA